MKVALITGGSRGIGAAAVEKFAKNGYSVILNYNRSESEAKALRQRLNNDGADVHLFKADVSNVGEVSAMFDYVGKYFKHLDVLINNAGVSLSKQLQDVTETEFDRVMSVNAKGVFFCCKYALPLLEKCCGTIVNVSSVWGVCGSSCESVYSMSKHAVVGLTRSLANELAPIGVNVSAICPPIVLTDMCSHLSAEDIAEFCVETQTKVYSPEQVAEQIYSLAVSGQSRIVTELSD